MNLVYVIRFHDWDGSWEQYDMIFLHESRATRVLNMFKATGFPKWDGAYVSSMDLDESE